MEVAYAENANNGANSNDIIIEQFWEARISFSLNNIKMNAFLFPYSNSTLKYL